jgi:hypothetical protein
LSTKATVGLRSLFVVVGPRLQDAEKAATTRVRVRGFFMVLSM